MPERQGDRRPPPWTWGELLLACDLVVANGWAELRSNDPRVVELSDLLQQLSTESPERRGSKFRNPNGVARKTVDLATHHPDYPRTRTRGGRLDVEMIQKFIDDPEGMARYAAELRYAVEAVNAESPTAPPLDLDLEDEPSPEGRVMARLHKIHERDPKLRARKIRRARQILGWVRCEVCAFDFESIYGSRGHDYIECHHRTPLSHSGPTMTDPDDLALLCSNCHRMIHRTRPWLTVEELSKLVAEQGQPAAING